jgi:hypothetical protein
VYLRKYRLVIQTFRGATITIPDELRWTFHVEKRINEYMQFAEVVIYNLNPNTETDIFKNAQYVTIEAGYEDSYYGQIFSGPVRQPIRGQEDGTTFFIKLVCVNDIMNLGFCSLVLNQGNEAIAIMNQIARSSSIPFDIRIKGPVKQPISERPKVVFSQPGDAIRSVALNNNGFVYVDDSGSANYSALSTGPTGNIPRLNAQTGLIGIPQQVDMGVSFRCLINPSIKLDSWVQLNNQDIVQAEVPLFGLQTLLDLDGLYRVIEIQATGDTRGNDWYFDIQAIGQQGALPQMLAGPNQNGA